MTDIKCSWWLHPGCENTATHLVLACCEQGHIHERLLCSKHCNEFTKYIQQRKCTCNHCPKPLVRYLDRSPVEDHWDLSKAIEDKTTILISYLQETTWTHYTPEQLEQLRRNLADTQEYIRKYMHTPIPVPYWVGGNITPEVYKKLTTPVDPEKLPDNPFTRWLRKQAKNEP